MEQRDWFYRVVTSFLDEHLPAGDAPVVVAVSGGVDSMVLLHLTHRYAQDRNRRLTAVHVHHGLRASADTDQEFVLSVCRQWGIPAQAYAVRLQEIPRHERKGIEADARRLRYQVLAAAARSLGAHAVLLGHHGDDQVESVLWRLARGTSLTGLAGIRPAVMRDGILWLRPLLLFAKRELAAYAAGCQVPFREDETNQSIRFTRNYIRKEIVPRLQHIQPNLTEAVGRLAQVLQEEDEWLDRHTLRQLEGHLRYHDGLYRIRTDVLQAMARPLQRRAIKIILTCLASEDFTFSHIESVLRIIESQRPSAQLHLPGGITAWREYGDLCIGVRHGADTEGIDPGEMRWRLADQAHLGWPPGTGTQWTFVCRAWEPEEGRKAPHLMQARFPAIPEITVRTFRPGDRLLLPSGHGTKKLQDVFTDAKIPKWLRRSWPIFCIDGRPVWVPGVIRAGAFLLHERDRHGWVIGASRRDGAAEHGHA